MINFFYLWMRFKNWFFKKIKNCFNNDICIYNLFKLCKKQINKIQILWIISIYNKKADLSNFFCLNDIK